MTWNELCTMHSGLVHFQNWNWWSSKSAWCLTFEDSVLKVEENNGNVRFGNTGRHFQDHDKFFMIPFEDKIQQGCEIIYYVTATIIITLRMFAIFTNQCAEAYSFWELSHVGALGIFPTRRHASIIINNSFILHLPSRNVSSFLLCFIDQIFVSI